MKNFNLYVLRQNLNNRHNPSLIPIGASHQSTTSYPQGTYNEKLTNKPNSQAQLTFNISTMCNGKHNRNADLMVNGQRLRLVFDNNKKTCQDFFITKVAPAVTQDNSILTITAVDWFSYQLSHTAIGLTYDTLDNGGVKSIQDLSKDILQQSNVTSWKLHPSLLDSYAPRFYEKDDKITPMRISFAVSGSNCYNALIEIAKKFDATIVPYYNWNGKGGYIDFINNNDYNSSIYHLSPSVNINKFSTNQQSNNLYTIMYVTGGEDAYGNPVTLTPAMPGALKYWLMEHMCYDDDKKPDCLTHNYPLLITKKLEDNKYSYFKYANSLYSGSTLTRALNTKSNLYTGLYATYDKNEEIVFSIPEPISEEESELKVYIGSQEFNNYSTRVTDYSSNLSTRTVEIRFNANWLLSSTDLAMSSSTKQLWAGYDVSKRTSANTATITIVSSSWTSKEEITINSIWEAQKTMIDIYELFKSEWDSTSTTSTTDPGLGGFKALDENTKMVSTLVANYCHYIDNNVPAAGNFLYNFDYFLQQHLMTPVDYYGLHYVLSRDVRKYNLLISIYGALYYDLVYQTNLSLATIKTYLMSFLGEIDVHMDSINELGSNTSKKITPSMPTRRNILNIVSTQANSSDILIPIHEVDADDLDEEYVSLEYYTNTCYNELLVIVSNILREGLTLSFVRNMVALYGKDFFTNISNILNDNPEYAIFQDKTEEYFNLLHQYDVLLGRGGTSDTHNCDYSNDIYDNGRMLEASKILAQANQIKNQASYYYNNTYDISRYQKEGHGWENSFYRPNLRTIFLNILQEFVLKEGSPYYRIITDTTTSFDLVDYYENLLEEKDELWTDIRARYGEFLLEGTYNDSTEITTTGLYNAALLSFSKANQPIYNYTVTSIDASQLVETGTENIQVGDRISIHHPAVFPKPNYKQTHIKIIDEGTDTTLQYRVPQKGAVVNNTNFTRYNLIESDVNNTMEIFDQILGSTYGTNIGTVIDSDVNNKEFTIEWNQEWPMFGIDLLTVLNQGKDLFFGDYHNISSINNYNSSLDYKAGDWFYDSETAQQLPSGKGYKVYQVGRAITAGTTKAEAIKNAYRVDVYCGFTAGSLNIGDLCIISKANYIENLKDIDKYYIEKDDAKKAELDAKYATLNEQLPNTIFCQVTHKATGKNNYKEVKSYPIYADFVYEAKELLLTITGVTQTLREHSTQLQVQDNSLINSLVDKILYSVRLN